MYLLGLHIPKWGIEVLGVIRESNLAEFSTDKVATLGILITLIMAFTFASTIGSYTHAIATTGFALNNWVVSIIVRVFNHG